MQDQPKIYNTPSREKHVHECACNRNGGGTCGPCTCEEELTGNEDFVASGPKEEFLKVKVEEHAPQCPTRYDEKRSCICLDINKTPIDFKTFPNKGQPSTMQQILEVLLRIERKLDEKNG